MVPHRIIYCREALVLRRVSLFAVVCVSLVAVGSASAAKDPRVCSSSSAARCGAAAADTATVAAMVKATGNAHWTSDVRCTPAGATLLRFKCSYTTRTGVASVAVAWDAKTFKVATTLDAASVALVTLWKAYTAAVAAGWDGVGEVPAA